MSSPRAAPHCFFKASRAAAIRSSPIFSAPSGASVSPSAVKPEALVHRAVNVFESLLPPRPGELWRHKSLALEALRLGTRRTRRAPILEAVDRPARLEELPVLTTWQEDGGPFVTLPLVYTEHPLTRKHNLGMYRMQRFDATTTGMHWQIHKGGGFHYHEAEKAGTCPAGHSLPRRAARADPLGYRTSARRRAGTCPRLRPRRREDRVADNQPERFTASAHRRSRVRSRRSRPAA